MSIILVTEMRQIFRTSFKDGIAISMVWNFLSMAKEVLVTIEYGESMVKLKI